MRRLAPARRRRDSAGCWSRSRRCRTARTHGPGRSRPMGRPAYASELTDARASWDGVATAVGPVDLDLEPGTRLLVTGPNGGGEVDPPGAARTAARAVRRALHRRRDRRTRPSRSRRSGRSSRSWTTSRTSSPRRCARTCGSRCRSTTAESGDAELVTALRRAGLGGWLGGLPDGLDTRLGSGGRGLSGGERARLAVARALLSGRPGPAARRAGGPPRPRHGDRGARRRARWRARPVRGGGQPHPAERGVLRPRAGPQPGAGLAVRVLAGQALQAGAEERAAAAAL